MEAHGKNSFNGGKEEMKITFSTLKENLLKPRRQEQKQRKTENKTAQKSSENPVSPICLWKMDNLCVI